MTDWTIEKSRESTVNYNSNTLSIHITVHIDFGYCLLRYLDNPDFFCSKSFKAGNV